MDKQGIKFDHNLDAEELYNASGNPMTVNGTVQLTAAFNGKSKCIDGLVSEDLKDEVQSLAKKLVIWAFSLIKHPFSRGPGRL